MIVALKPNVSPEKQERLVEWFKEMGLGVHVSTGTYQTVLGLIGDTTKVDMDLVGSLDIVEKVSRVTETFKCCNRKFHPDDTVIDVNGVKIGERVNDGMSRFIWEGVTLRKGDNEIKVVAGKGKKAISDSCKWTLK